MRRFILKVVVAVVFFSPSALGDYECPTAKYDATEAHLPKYYGYPNSAYCYYFILANGKQCSLAAPYTKAEFDVLLKHVKARNRDFPGAKAYATGLVSNRIKKKFGKKNYQLQEYATEREVDNYLNLNLIDVGFLIIDANASAKLVPMREIMKAVSHVICQLPAENVGHRLKRDERAETTDVAGAPTEAPTETPTKAPMEASTKAPTKTPTEAPTEAPMGTPTEAPMGTPTKAPMEGPTGAPTGGPPKPTVKTTVTEKANTTAPASVAPVTPAATEKPSAASAAPATQPASAAPHLSSVAPSAEPQNPEAQTDTSENDTDMLGLAVIAGSGVILFISLMICGLILGNVICPAPQMHLQMAKKVNPLSVHNKTETDTDTIQKTIGTGTEQSDMSSVIQI